MPETAVLLAAYGSAFALMSFCTSIFVRKEEETGRYKFRGDTHFTSNVKAAVAIMLNIVLVIILEEFVIQPYLVSLYEQNSGKIIQLLIASFLALFLTVWFHVGITDNNGKIALFVIGCLGALLLFIEGFRLFPIW